MKSFNHFINEAEAQQPQRERRRIPKVLSPTTPPPAEPPANPAGRRRTRPSAVVRDLEAASAPTAPTLTRAQRAAIEKGYRTPTGQQTIRGLETYATRRGAMGYGDAGKDPAQYGVDPRAVSAQSRERTAAAAAGDPVARSGIKSDYKKIDTKYPNPNPTTGFADFSKKATAAANASRPTGVPVVPQTPENTYIRNMQDQGRPVDPTFVKLQGIKASGDDKPEMIGQSAPTGQGAEFRRQRAQPAPEPATKPVGTGEVSRAAARNDAFRDMEDDLVRPRRGTVGVTQGGSPITTSTTRTSTNPAPAPAPQRAATSNIDKQRQSAAASTPDAVKKQNAAVMGSAARTLGRGLSAYSGYNTGVQRGEGTQGALVRGIGAAAATDALSAAAYRMLPKPLKTVGAVVTHAASQQGVNSLITVLRQQLGMK
tara:strand:- start:1453 stop:2730 length:1278 start_codon:yes stop_codon:yes gene_type:complete